MDKLEEPHQEEVLNKIINIRQVMKNNNNNNKANNQIQNNNLKINLKINLKTQKTKSEKN